MTMFAYQLVSKKTGEETFHRISASSKTALVNYLYAKLGNSERYHVGAVFTKLQLADYLWGKDIGGIRHYSGEGVRWMQFDSLPTATRHMIAAEIWKEYTTNGSSPDGEITLHVAKHAMEAAKLKWF